jgi:hypothetical protein
LKASTHSPHEHTANDESITALLSSKAHLALLEALCSTNRTSELKLFEAILRSLKSLYTSLVKLVGPRTWGTQMLGSVKKEPYMTDVKASKARATGSPIAELAKPALQVLFAVRSSTDTSLWAGTKD